MASTKPQFSPLVVIVKLPEDDRLRQVDQDLEIILKRLSVQDRSNVKKYRAYRDQMRSLISKAIVYNFISQYIIQDKKDIKIIRDENGRPYLTSAHDWDFNLSHHGDYVVVGFITRSDCTHFIGVDVASIDTNALHGDLNEFFQPFQFIFSDFEWIFVHAGTSLIEKHFRFACLWAIKEAVVKAIGCGIEMDLRWIRVKVDNLQSLSLPSVPGFLQVGVTLEKAPYDSYKWRVDLSKLDGQHVLTVARMQSSSSIRDEWSSLSVDYMTINQFISLSSLSVPETDKNDPISTGI